MEEVYKPKDGDETKVDIYQHDNSDMLGDMPGWLIHTGSYIVYGLIVLLLVGAAFINYPDTVEQRININNMGSVEWITANHAGIIDCFFVEDRTAIRKGDTLAMLRNDAVLEDVKLFCQVLTRVEYYYRTNDVAYLKQYPFDLIMGEMATAYEQFTQAVRTNLMYDEFDLYLQRRKFLEEEMDILTREKKDEAMAMLNVKRELFELEIGHKMEQNKNRRMLELAYENMVNSLKSWEEKYLVKSRSSGIAVWGSSWSLNKNVSQGDTLCTVVSQQAGMPVGHMQLSEERVSEVAVGNPVNIELSKYPAHSYGILVGRVAGISFVPRDKSYALEVEFPNGMRTTTGREIAYEIGMNGQAEIVTSSRSILKRVLAPIRELF